MSGKVAFDLIKYKCKSLKEFQLPRAHLPFLRIFIKKYLKKEVDDDLSVCMDERKPLWPLYNWRYKDLSLSRDQKVMTLLPPMEKCPIDFYLSMMFIWCPNFMFLASLWLEFQTSHFADSEQFKVDSYFANFGQVKIEPIRFFYDFWQVSYFTPFG